MQKQHGCFIVILFIKTGGAGDVPQNYNTDQACSKEHFSLYLQGFKCFILLINIPNAVSFFSLYVFPLNNVRTSTTNFKRLIPAMT